MIGTMVRLMEEHTAELVVCGYYFKIENEKNGNIATAYLEEKSYPFSVFHSFDEIRSEYIPIWDSDMFSNVWNKLYSMDTIKKYGMRFRDGHVYTEDRVFNRLFLSKCQSLVITDKCLYYYVRERTGSTTEKYRDDSFDIRQKEYTEFKAHFKEMGIWDAVSREYTSREFVERIAGCIENVFHGDMGIGEKYNRIGRMIHHKDVREAVKYARCRSLKMRIFVMPIKWNWTLGAYIMGLAIYLIRRSNPVIFHKLKSRR
jgi:glycosyltransferase EpsJ